MITVKPLLPKPKRTIEGNYPDRERETALLDAAAASTTGGAVWGVWDGDDLIALAYQGRVYENRFR
jgi:hypothetical protein